MDNGNKQQDISNSQSSVIFINKFITLDNTYILRGETMWGALMVVLLNIVLTKRESSRDDRDTFKKDMAQMLSDFKIELSIYIYDMKADVASC